MASDLHGLDIVHGQIKLEHIRLADDTNRQSYLISKGTKLGSGLLSIKTTFQLLPHVCMRIFEFGDAEFAVPGTTPRFNGLLSEILDNSASAPETIISRERGFPADIWGLGCTLVEMFTGQPRLFGEASTTIFGKLGMMQKLCGGNLGLDQLITSTQRDAMRDASLEGEVWQRAHGEMKTLKVGSSPSSVQVATWRGDSLALLV